MALGDIRIISNGDKNGTREIKLSVVVGTSDKYALHSLVPEEKKVHVKFRIRGNDKPCLILDSKYEDGVFIYKRLENYGKLWQMPFAAKLYVGQLLPGGATGEDIAMLLDMFMK